MKRTDLEKLRSASIEANSGAFTPADFQGVLTGFSGQKLMCCLQRFTQLLCGPDRIYVELGVFQGMTLLSNAAVNPGIDCFGIDNFSLFNEGKKNLFVVQERMSKLKLTNAHILNMDFEAALLSLDRHIGNRKVGVFFVDGPHDYRSQLLPLLLAKPYLADCCAIFVDDANYAHVRQASVDFLRTEPEFALLFEAYTPGHLANLQGADKQAAIDGWWNGVNVMVRDPERLIERRYPREESKALYFESHEVFRHEFAELAYPALQAVQAVADDAATEDVLGGLKPRLIEHRQQNPKRFKHQNTYSDGLPSFAIHG